MKIIRPLLLLAALLASLTAVRAEVESAASIFTNANLRAIPERRTSIIYLQCHSLGYGDLSCYGQTNFQTPNLDRLAAEGIRFTNFRPGGTNFTDALAALMSGKNSGGRNEPTFAARLQAAGYHTGLIGEWTLDEKPWTRGFDEFAGFLNEQDGRNYYAEKFRRFAPKSWINDDNTIVDFDRDEAIYENAGGKKEIYLPEFMFNWTCNFVKNHAPDQFNHYQPFFLLVNLPTPHSAKAGADEFPVPSDAPFTSEAWPQAAKDRASLLTRLDGGIGRLLDQFKQVGITNNICVIFSSSAAPEKFADAKMNFLAPNGQAVAGKNNSPAPLPLIAWWPEGIPAGQVSGFNVTGADFAPTVLDIGYARPVKDLDGISVLPVLLGKKGPQVDDGANREF